MATSPVTYRVSPEVDAELRRLATDRLDAVIGNFMDEPLVAEQTMDDSGDYAACPHCGEVWANEFLRDDKRVPTHDFPRPYRAVCPGSGHLPVAPTVAQVRKWNPQAQPESGQP